jgi:hypothetical protein
MTGSYGCRWPGRGIEPTTPAERLETSGAGPVPPRPASPIERIQPEMPDVHISGHARAVGRCHNVIQTDRRSAPTLGQLTFVRRSAREVKVVQR